MWKKTLPRPPRPVLVVGSNFGYQPVAGGRRLYVSAQCTAARAICLRLFLHLALLAASRTFCTAGMRRPIRMAMIAITTRSSMSVKPRRWVGERDMVEPPDECGRDGRGAPTVGAGDRAAAIKARFARRGDRPVSAPDGRACERSAPQRRRVGGLLVCREADRTRRHRAARTQVKPWPTTTGS